MTGAVAKDVWLDPALEALDDVNWPLKSEVVDGVPDEIGAGSKLTAGFEGGLNNKRRFTVIVDIRSIEGRGSWAGSVTGMTGAVGKDVWLDPALEALDDVNWPLKSEVVDGVPDEIGAGSKLTAGFDGGLNNKRRFTGVDGVEIEVGGKLVEAFCGSI
uniref:Uncharacterized protein n=1 Tax=Panagrolaimus sp. JU765 TaxID=591449 RepID=A0AC34QQB9_9BILA